MHNWNQVCNGGLTAGALAVGDEEPACAGKMLHDALASVQAAMHSYAPDGGWGEGPGYWSYATSYNVTMLACLESALGTDFGLSQSDRLRPDRPVSRLHDRPRPAAAFNFADCGENTGPGAIACCGWAAASICRPPRGWPPGRWAHGRGHDLVSRPGQDPAAAGLPLDKYWRSVEVATMRSRWNDPQAVFVGIKAGSNAINHQHLDIGSFVLDALGQRWAVDLGGDDYNLPGYFGRQRYDYYRLRAEGHNTLVIDPGGRSGPGTEGRDADPPFRCRAASGR